MQEEETQAQHDMPGARPTLPRQPLDRFGISELHAYIAELRHEIDRAEMEVARKEDHRNAADNVFRRP